MLLVSFTDCQQRFLSGILNELSNLKRKSYGVRRFLKAKRVSHDIESFKQRLETLKGNFLVELFYLILNVGVLTLLLDSSSH